MMHMKVSQKVKQREKGWNSNVKYIYSNEQKLITKVSAFLSLF